MVVVVRGNVLHHVKREGELSVRVKCPDGTCPDPAAAELYQVWLKYLQSFLSVKCEQTYTFLHTNRRR